MKMIKWDAKRSGGTRASCCVRALQYAFDLTYENANGIAEQFGRKQNAGMYRNQWEPMFEQMAKRKRRAFRRVPKKYWPGKTVASFAKEAGRGTYIVGTRGHMLCIKDGKVWDWTEGRRHRVESVYVVEAV